jgi:hypothetical protein
MTEKVKTAPARIKEIESQLSRKITPPDQIMDVNVVSSQALRPPAAERPRHKIQIAI